MRKTLYGNLDRPFSFFGIKGIFLAVAVAGAAVILIASIIVGALTSVFAGLATAAFMAVMGYLSLIELQHRFGQKTLGRKISGWSIPGYVRVNSKAWKR